MSAPLALPEMDDQKRELWRKAQSFGCLLTVELDVPKVTMRDLLRMETGSIVQTRWSQALDLPLRANGEVIAWTEFEVVGDRLAVRLTELE